MRAVIQRVTKASVTVGEEIVGSIGRGLCVLVGIHRDDKDDDMEYIVRKILNLRLFDCEGNGKKWDKSVKDLDLEVISISQFTLFGQLKGNKVDFHNSMGPNEAGAFYARFLEALKKAHKLERIQDGKFAAYMSVNIENDGPVTINLDSKNRE
ncbi:unnamed protein product, partial [Mesorhabditis belari]|uniref:D-aminoacyl-tRNA deacylase n=1 Tax=Mesorhabditis belari TaxID=2138241 RepID=A0AAF3EW37_9BILA